VSHSSFRYYYARDFERHWRRRLYSPQPPTSTPSHLHVEITHRFLAPNRYGWEIRPATGSPVDESRVQFASWEEASRAGRLALRQFESEG
jgi:hypothetical protein